MTDLAVADIDGDMAIIMHKVAGLELARLDLASGPALFI
jgi:hypothetical protein